MTIYPIILFCKIIQKRKVSKAGERGGEEAYDVLAVLLISMHCLRTDLPEKKQEVSHNSTLASIHMSDDYHIQVFFLAAFGRRIGHPLLKLLPMSG